MTSSQLRDRAELKRKDWANILEVAGKHVERAAQLEVIHRGDGNPDQIEHDFFTGESDVFTCPASKNAIQRAEDLYLDAQATLETMMDLKEQAQVLERREKATAHAVRMRHAHPVTRAVTGLLRRVLAGVS